MLPIIGAFESFANPKHLNDVTSALVRQWFAHLRDNKKSPETIKSYWGHLRSFLSIALDDGLIAKVPRVRLPKSDRKSLSKGRPINLEEFERMIEAAEHLKRINIDDFKTFLWGLWYGGLRISEAHRLTWSMSGFYVDLEREHPMFVIAEQKNKKKQMLPMTPDFVEHLRQVPTIRRNGAVFKLLRSNGDRMTLAHAKRTVAKCGKVAKIITGKKIVNGESEAKTASAHDLRRSFAQRWAVRVLPQVLQQLMRHRDIATTMKYYADLDAETLATQIFALGGQKGGQSRKRATSQKSKS